jgi:hypothetical protein
MTRLTTGALALPATVFLCAASLAQAQNQAPEVYIYGTYEVCDLAKQDRSDEISMQIEKPVLDAAVADQAISGYGRYAHNTGGQWRRLSYTSGPSVQALLDAGKMINDKINAANKKLGQEYSTICNSHDDYIWRRVAGSSGSTSPGGVVFSTYFVCDQTREDQADMLVEKVFAPTYDKMVADGKLKSWGWLEHIVGGKYRRVATMGAADLKALMAARAEVVQAMDNAAGNAFTGVCGDHTDYIWNVQYTKP